MSTRRDALRFLAAATAALPAVASPQETKEVQDQPGHVHTGPVVQIGTPGRPTFLQPDEFRLVEALSERIIPRSDTPGAKDAKVALLIDKALMVAPGLQDTFRAGLADLNTSALSTYGKDFVSLSDDEQIKVLTPISLNEESPLGKFFLLAKSMTIDGYYKTEAGLKTELGWHGNTFLAEFPGCDHPDQMS